MNRLSNKRQWPVVHPDAGVQDGRWSITKEFTGNFNNIGQPDYVFRFCDDFISSHSKYDDAKDAAQDHANKHFASLRDKNDYYVICHDTICTGYEPIKENDEIMRFGTEVLAENELASDPEFYDGCFICLESEIGHKTIYTGQKDA